MQRQTAQLKTAKLLPRVMQHESHNNQILAAIINSTIMTTLAISLNGIKSADNFRYFQILFEKKVPYK